MNGTEQITLEIDERPAVAAVGRANTAIEGHETKVKTFVDTAGRKWESYGDSLVRVTDKSRSSLDRLVQSMERQAAVAGKSGTEKLIAERDILIRKWGQEEAAVKSITAAYDKMIAAEGSGGGESRWSKFGEGIKSALENPLEAVKGLASGIVEKLGPVGTIVAGVATALGAVVTIGFEAAKSLAEYGLQIRNVELRTGFTSKEVAQFGFAARVAGQDASIFERMMRQLSQASDDGSKEGEKVRTTLQRLGVDLRSVTGEAKPTAQVMTEIAEGLNKLPAGMQRDAAALDLFKRAGIEAVPVIAGLSENIKRAKELGLGATEEDLARWEQYHQKVTEAEMLWERFTRKIKEPLAATVMFLFSDKSGHEYTLEELAARGVNLGKWAPRSQFQEATDMANAGFKDNRPAIVSRIDDSALDYTSKIEKARAADAAVLDYQKSQGLDWKLKQAEDALNAMPKPSLGTNFDMAPYRAAESKVQGIKDQIQANKDLAAEQKKTAEAVSQFRRAAQEFERRGDEAELDTIGKIWYQRDLLLKQAQGMKGVEGDIAGIRKAADAEVNAQISKDMAGFGAAAQNSLDARRSASNLNNLPASQSQIKDAIDGFDTQDRINSMNMQAQKEALNHQASQAQKMVGLDGLTGLDAIKAAYQIRVDLAKELAVVEAARIEKEDKDTAKLFAQAEMQRDIQKEMDEAREEALMKQLELIKQQTETLKKDTESLWTTLLTHPAKFGKQLGDTVHAAVVKPIADGMAGMTARVLQPIIYGADGGSGIAGAFKGAFGGGQQNPMKLSTDMNTGVTAQNSTALATLTAVLAGAMGIAAPAVASPAGMGGLSLPSISVSALSVPGVFRSGGPSITSGGAGYSFQQSFGGGSGGVSGSPDVVGGAADIFGLPVSSRTTNLPLMGALFGGGAAGGGSANPLASILSMSTAGKSGGGLSGNLAGMFKGFRGNLGGFTHSAGVDADGNPIEGPNADGGGINGVNGLAGAALSGGGMMLAQQGLLGSSRGTALGTVEGGIGGAAIGMQMGGPLGALIGGAAGTLIGVGEMLAGVETPENKAKRLCKQIYSISIDSGMAKQIASLAQQKYGGNVEIAVRDPETRKMLQLYATGTGQKFPLSASTPQAGALQQSGGQLQQVATYQNGNPYTFQSNLPVAGGFTSGTYASPSAGQTLGASSVTLNVNGQSAADLLEGRIASTVTPGFVQGQYSDAMAGSNGRLDNSAMFQQPGLITS